MLRMVLWGHSFEDYKEMFDIKTAENFKRILEFGCGPTAINATQKENHLEVVSCDPFFTLDKATLLSKTSLIFADMLKKIRSHAGEFNFSQHGGLDNLAQERQAGIDRFFEDYEQGKKEGRYLGVTDLKLPFADFSFDLAVCSHYFFAELENQDISFHVNMLQELARVAKEVRVFPLIDRASEVSLFLGPVLLSLQQGNYGAEVREVPYHFQAQGNAMLRIWALECAL